MLQKLLNKEKRERRENKKEEEKRRRGAERGCERDKFLQTLNIKVMDLDQKMGKIATNMKKDVSEVKKNNKEEVKKLDGGSRKSESGRDGNKYE